ncbi:MAG: GNAT family protein [Pseudomonadota bacterium]
MTLGPTVENWTPRESIRRHVMQGRLVRMEPLDVAKHGPAMFEQFRDLDPDGAVWTYMPDGPFPEWEGFRAAFQAKANSQDPMFFAIVEIESGEARGVASYLRDDPANGVVEVGWIAFSPKLQRTPQATEAMYLMMRHVFDDLGYRRYEWKCNNGNAASKRAAIRLGMTPEGVFRQAVVVKGRNRDTAWFSILDHEWPAQKARFETWLSPSNFDEAGRQIRRLEECGRSADEA